MPSLFPALPEVKPKYQNQQKTAAGAVLIAPPGQYAEKECSRRQQNPMLYLIRLSQKIPVKGDKAQNKNASPQIIACAAYPEHGLSETHRKPPQKSNHKQKHKYIIFSFAPDICVHQKNQRYEHKAVHKVKHLLTHRQRQPHIKLPYHPSAV